MVTVRRWYIFLVCAVSLNAATWAVIFLLRNLLLTVIGFYAQPLYEIAFQLAVIIVGLPVYLVHWHWAQSLARRDLEERDSALRCFYLLAIQAALLGPFLANSFDFLVSLLWLTPEATADYNLPAMLVTGLLWYYHFRVIREDIKGGGKNESGESLRRVFVYSFIGLGILLVTIGNIYLLRWVVLSLFDPGRVLEGFPMAEIARILIGLPLWLVFWYKGDSLFGSSEVYDRQSAVRRFYLYTVLFISTVAVAVQATVLLAALFSHLLDVPLPEGSGTTIPILIVMGLLWFYHAYILRKETALEDAPKQAGVRRVFSYLMATIGLVVFLAGLSGDFSVLIRQFAETFGSGLRQQLAWFSAALIVGLPIWLLAWRQASFKALEISHAGEEERRSLVRKIYLYFFMFISTITLLGSLVTIISQIISLALGVPFEGNLLVFLESAIAFSIVAGGVWIYHYIQIRQDTRLRMEGQTEHITSWKVAIMNPPEGWFGKDLLQALKKDLPGLPVNLIALNPPLPDTQVELQDYPSQLAQANLIVGPSYLTNPCGGDGAVTPEIAQMIFLGEAHKLLYPVFDRKMDWIGVDRLENQNLVRQAAAAVKQVVNGDSVHPIRSMSIGSIFGIVFGSIFLLLLLFTFLMLVFRF